MRIHRSVPPLLVTIGVLVATSAGADTITGEVIDLSCYLHHPATSRGPTHRKCAETCAKKGLPMGLLAEDGSVVLLLEDHGNPKAYAEALGKAAETITVDGEKVVQGGLTGIVVEEVK
jgi:hypothetical protein